MCCVWIPKSQRLNILLFFSQFKLTLLNHQKSLQLNFIILVLFSCGLLINSLFPVDSTPDLPTYYFASILHLGALFKSQQVFGAVAGIRQLEKRSTLLEKFSALNFFTYLVISLQFFFFLSSLVFFQSFSFIFTSLYC